MLLFVSGSKGTRSGIISIFLNKMYPIGYSMRKLTMKKTNYRASKKIGYKLDLKMIKKPFGNGKK